MTDNAQSANHHPGANDEINLRDLLGFFTDSWTWMLGSATLLSATSAVVILNLPREYQSSCLLLVNNPEKTALFAPISVQGYQRLLESSDLIRKIRERALSEHNVSDSEAKDLMIGKDLKVVINTAKRDDSALSPLIELQVTANDPTVAADLANSWSDNGIASVSKLLKTAYLPQIEQTEQAYLKAVADFAARRAEVESTIARWKDTTVGARSTQGAGANDLSISFPNSGLSEFTSFLSPELIAAKNAVASLEAPFAAARQARLQFTQPTVSIASPAVAASQPLERKAALKIGVAAFAGSIIGLLVAGSRRILRSKI
jgi:uncharacterized protein involved in exopolysaccharide biosynthesis